MCNFTVQQCANFGTEKCNSCFGEAEEFEFPESNDIRCHSFNVGIAGECAWVKERIEDESDMPSLICMECLHQVFTSKALEIE